MPIAVNIFPPEMQCESSVVNSNQDFHHSHLMIDTSIVKTEFLPASNSSGVLVQYHCFYCDEEYEQKDILTIHQNNCSKKCSLQQLSQKSIREQKRKFLDTLGLIRTGKAELLKSQERKDVVCDVIVIDDDSDDQSDSSQCASAPKCSKSLLRRTNKSVPSSNQPGFSVAGITTKKSKKLFEIAITSPLGLRVKNHFKCWTDSSVRITELMGCSYEFLCGNNAKKIADSKPKKPFPVTFPKRQHDHYQQFCHSYKFTKLQAIRFCQTIDTGLSSRARKLKTLLKTCDVKLNKLDLSNPNIYISPSIDSKALNCVRNSSKTSVEELSNNDSRSDAISDIKSRCFLKRLGSQHPQHESAKTKKDHSSGEEETVSMASLSSLPLSEMDNSMTFNSNVEQPSELQILPDSSCAVEASSIASKPNSDKNEIYQQKHIPNTIPEHIQNTNSEKISIANSEHFPNPNSEHIQNTNLEKIPIANSEHFPNPNSEHIQNTNLEKIPIANSEHFSNQNSEHIQNTNLEKIPITNSEHIRNTQSEKILNTNIEQFPNTNSVILEIDDDNECCGDWFKISNIVSLSEEQTSKVPSQTTEPPNESSTGFDVSNQEYVDLSVLENLKKRVKISENPPEQFQSNDQRNHLPVWPVAPINRNTLTNAHGGGDVIILDISDEEDNGSQIDKAKVLPTVQASSVMELGKTFKEPSPRLPVNSLNQSGTRPNQVQNVIDLDIENCQENISGIPNREVSANATPKRPRERKNRTSYTMKMNDPNLPALEFKCSICNHMIKCDTNAAARIRFHYATHNITNIDFVHYRAADGKLRYKLIEIPAPIESNSDVNAIPQANKSSPGGINRKRPAVPSYGDGDFVNNNGYQPQVAYRLMPMTNSQTKLAPRQSQMQPALGQMFSSRGQSPVVQSLNQMKASPVKNTTNNVANSFCSPRMVFDSTNRLSYLAQDTPNSQVLTSPSHQIPQQTSQPNSSIIRGNLHTKIAVNNNLLPQKQCQQNISTTGTNLSLNVQGPYHQNYRQSRPQNSSTMGTNLISSSADPRPLNPRLAGPKNSASFFANLNLTPRQSLMSSGGNIWSNFNGNNVVFSSAPVVMPYSAKPMYGSSSFIDTSRSEHSNVGKADNNNCSSVFPPMTTVHHFAGSSTRLNTTQADVICID